VVFYFSFVFAFLQYFLFLKKPIGGVIVSLSTSSAVGRGFELRSGQIKDYINWYVLLHR